MKAECVKWVEEWGMDGQPVLSQVGSPGICPGCLVGEEDGGALGLVTSSRSVTST